MTCRNRTEIAIQILKPVYDNDDDGEDIIQSKIMYTVYLEVAG